MPIKSKLKEYLNSESIDDLYLLNTGISIISGLFIFNYINPIWIFVIINLFKIEPGFIYFLLFYILNLIVTIFFVKWQNSILRIKSIAFRKKYSLIISMLFLIFTLINWA
jgi:hypothetical protein